MAHGWRVPVLRPVLSAFIALNVGTVAFMNRPAWLADAMDRLTKRLPPQLAARSAMAGYRVRQYANLTGLDARWEMFSAAKGDDWRYRIVGVFDDKGAGAKRERLLPLPGQTKRGFWDEWLFDFKEGKYRLNTASDPRGRRAYAEWLCRRFAGHEGERLDTVIIYIEYRRILEPDEARRTGYPYDAKSITRHALEASRCAG